jgi:hypothetical protein
MSKKSSATAWAVVTSALAVLLALAGGRWLWHFILAMHGIH